MTYTFSEVKEMYKDSQIPTFTEYLIEVLRDGNVVVLDTETISWLELFVKEYEGGLENEHLR